MLANLTEQLQASPTEGGFFMGLGLNDHLGSLPNIALCNLFSQVQYTYVASSPDPMHYGTILNSCSDEASQVAETSKLLRISVFWLAQRIDHMIHALMYILYVWFVCSYQLNVSPMAPTMYIRTYGLCALTN